MQGFVVSSSYGTKPYRFVAAKQESEGELYGSDDDVYANTALDSGIPPPQDDEIRFVKSSGIFKTISD